MFESKFAETKTTSKHNLETIYVLNMQGYNRRNGS